MPIQLVTLGGLSVIADGQEVSGLGSQPVRASLLLYLAVEGTAGRESVIAALWPDHEPQAARHVLSQTLYQLRHDLGGDWLHVDGEALRVTPAIWLDAHAFDSAVDAGEYDAALALYRGPFLQDCRLVSTNAFETWVDRQRGRLARLHRRARRERVAELTTAGELARALEMARGWVAIDPIEDEAQHALIELLGAAGRRDAALRQYGDYARLLAGERLEPLDQTRELADRLRRGDQVVARGIVPASAPAVPGEGGVAASAESGQAAPARAPRGRMRWIGVAAAVGLAAVATWAVLSRQPTPPLKRERVLVLPFENETGDSTLDRVGVMAADWITQGLARTGRLKPLPSVEVLRRLQGAEATEREVGFAQARTLAQATGAGTLVSGRFYQRGDELEFFAQVVDVGLGELWYAAEPVRAPLEAPERAIDAVSQRITGTLAARVYPGFPLEPAAVLHPPTYQAYSAYITGIELGLRGDFRGAIPYLDEAVRLDTTFVRARLSAASAYGNIGEQAAAESVLAIVAQRRSELSPYERAHLAYAQANYGGDLVGAFEAGRKVTELAPGGPAHYVWVRHALGLGRYQDVIDAYRTLDLEPDWTVAWFDTREALAAAQHGLGQYRSELETARADKRTRPDRRSAVFLELRALAALGRLDELRRLASRVPDLPAERGWSTIELLGHVAAELRAHGHEIAADEILAQAIATYESRGGGGQTQGGRVALAGALMQAGRLPEADSLLARLGSEYPDDIQILGLAGLLAARLGDVAAAESISGRLAGIERPYAFGEPLYWRAVIAANLDRPEQAEAFLRQAFAQGRRLGFFLHADANLEVLWDRASYQTLVNGHFTRF